MFGGWNQFAWGACVLLMFVPGVGGGEVHYDFLRFLAPSEVVQGTVLDVIEEEHHSGHRWGWTTYTTYEHRYVYRVSDHTYWGTSHAHWRADDYVDVEFLTGEPRHSRIVGMSTLPASGWITFAAFAGLFTCIGWSWWRARHLDRIVTKIGNQLVMLPPYSAVGFYPKFRLDHRDRLVAKACSPLLVMPFFAVLFAVFAVLILVT